MILLKKGPIPQVLVDKKTEWTNELMAYVKKGEKIPTSVGNKYNHPDIKKALLEETCYKCAYCESKILHIDYGDIEHIEAKSHVREKTFEWDNLTIACGKCNLSKKDYYDIDLMLLNPYVDEVEKEVVFVGFCVYPLSDRAKVTVKTIDLNRTELVAQRKEHIENLMPLIETYVNAKNATVRNMIYQDILEKAEVDKEYSAMTKAALKQIDFSDTTVKIPN